MQNSKKKFMDSIYNYYEYWIIEIISYEII